MQNKIKELIEQADMVLVGLGEEFNDISYLKTMSEFEDERRYIEESGHLWLLPAYYKMCREKLLERQEQVKEALCKLEELLKGKNYFLVSTSVNNMIAEIPWKEGRLVMPCGSILKKQCCTGCQAVLEEVTQADMEAIFTGIMQIIEKGRIEQSNSEVKPENICMMGSCSECGAPLILNNIYAEKYNEQGYLSQWQIYTKWLQGTLNRNVVVLELGVGMQFPSVVRWPFEKIAFFNQKASFCRVNMSLYQMSEELKGKGISIAENSIDWLRAL